MKKLFCILFCLLFTAFALVGCGDVEREEWLGDGKKDDDGYIIGGKYNGYPTVSEIPYVNINLYIIVEDSTWQSEDAVVIEDNNKLGVVTQSINTVNNAIKDFTSTQYHTEVNVVYVSEKDYDKVVLDAVKADNTNAAAASIVLVNSYKLMQELYATGKLCSLDSYLATTKYGTLNESIPDALLQASKLEKTEDGNVVKNLYSIPNNHVIGKYEYLLINKETAIANNISEEKARTLLSYESALEAFGYDVANVPSDVIALVSGSYENRYQFEAQGYYCNVVNNPIADKNEAFTSAFAIVNRNTSDGKIDYNERAMEVVYGINTNPTLRNLLQYGVAGTNYTLEEDGSVVLIGGSNRYDMNLIYTGDILEAYYCQSINWDDDAKKNAINQNSDSQIVEVYSPSQDEE